MVLMETKIGLRKENYKYKNKVLQRDSKNVIYNNIYFLMYFDLLYRQIIQGCRANLSAEIHKLAVQLLFGNVFLSPKLTEFQARHGQEGTRSQKQIPRTVCCSSL